LQTVRATPKIPEWERIAARIAHHLELAVRGDQSLDDALSALDRDVDAILEKRRWLRSREGRLTGGAPAVKGGRVSGRRPSEHGREAAARTGAISGCAEAHPQSGGRVSGRRP